MIKIQPPKKVNYPRIRLGENIFNEGVYLEPPSWDCDWYWGFGYLETKNQHYHLSNLSKVENLKDAFNNHFKNFIVTDEQDKWKLAELIETIYSLRKTAEVYYRGGSHLTFIEEESKIVKDEKQYFKLNYEVIPKLFKMMYNILEKYHNEQ